MDLPEAAFLNIAGAKMLSIQRCARHWYHRELAPLLERWHDKVPSLQLSPAVKRHLQTAEQRLTTAESQP